jgi:hypothetical protein
MNMLTYLVRSRARRRLLMVLWTEGHSGSVSELARLTGMGFATVHRELAEMEQACLAICERIGNASVYKANFQHPESFLLKRLLDSCRRGSSRKSNWGKIDKRVIMALLRSMGAPIHIESAPLKLSMSREEALAGALALARRDPLIARILPVVINRNIDRLNVEKLKYYAKRRGSGRTLGFFLDLTAELSGRDALRALADSLIDRRARKKQDFFTAPKGKYDSQLAGMNTPPVAEKWHYRMNMGMDGFETLFRKHAG